MSFYHSGITISLDFLGDGWGDAYLKFSPLTMAEALELGVVDGSTADSLAIAKKAVGILESKFIEGKAPNKKKELVTIKAGDIGELPPQVFTVIFTALVGDVEKKVPEPSDSKFGG